MGDLTKLPLPEKRPGGDRNDHRTRGKPGTRVTKAMRRHQVVSLLLAGASEVDIAKALGITPGRVSTIVMSVLDAWESAERANVDKVRALQVARIDRLIQAHWNAAIGVRADGTATAPSVKATAEIRNLEALRARIVGTEAARKFEVSGSLGFHLEASEVERADEAWLASSSAAEDVIDAVALELPAAGDG